MRQDFDDLMLSLSMVGENGEEEEQIVPLVDWCCFPACCCR